MNADESLERAGKQDKMQQNGSKLGRSRKVNDSKGQVSKPRPKSRTQNVINPRSKKRMTKPAQGTTSARSRIVEVTKENTLRLPLCRAALQALEAQTANHPLPKGLQTVLNYSIFKKLG